MKLAAPATAAAVTVLLAGLAGLGGPPAGGGQPGRDRAPAVSGGPAAALGTVTLASHDTRYRAEPRPPVSASRGAGLGAAQAGTASPGEPTWGIYAPAVARAWRLARTAPPQPPAVAGPFVTDIAGVACPTVLECVAGGYYYDSSDTFRGLLLTGHGSSWTAAQAAVPAGAATRPQPIISGVACPSAGECVAVGSYQDSSGNSQGLLLTGHGSSWTAARAPVPPGAAGNSGVTITEIACPSAGECVAVGFWVDSSLNSHLFLLTMRGSSWTAATAPLPAGASASYGAGVSVLACPSATACTAAGSYNDSSGTAHLFLLTMGGSSWTAATTALPAGAPAIPYIFIEGIACRSAAVCIATGWYGDANAPPAGNQGLLLTQHGSSWTAATAPLPGGITAPYTSVWAAACSAGAGCVAVGDYQVSPASSGGLLLTRQQTSWTAATAPVPAGAAANPLSSIMAVACPPAGTCTAGGSYQDSSGHAQGLLLTRLRWSWTAARAPVPSGAATNPEVSITGIACPSVTTCAAIGGYTDSVGNIQGLVLTRHCSSWTAVRAPLPADAADRHPGY
ncbi:MAG TPA: hypothetical protein VMH35_20130 [Streptosporangiaceae bacterium]|nr:hypothetical protein [Streptosporangiaceae bacterium]